MQANRGRDTSPELRVRRLAHAAGLRYRVNARPLPGERLTADLVFSRARVAVFVDGCFWHGCNVHYRPATKNAAFWENKIKENVRRDAKASARLEDAGWTVIRAWEHDPPDEVVKRIVKAVRGAS